LTTTISEAGKRLRGVTYDEKLVQKAVHLVRSPWDNMVSRMHHAIKNAAKLKLPDEFIARITTDDPRANMRDWCRYVDSLLPLNVQATFKTNNKNVTDDIPCLMDLYRYVYWHNWAL
jgi:hypothetical protein